MLRLPSVAVRDEVVASVTSRPACATAGEESKVGDDFTIVGRTCAVKLDFLVRSGLV